MTERTIIYRLRAVTSGLTGPVKQAREEIVRTGSAVGDFARRNDRAMTTAGMASMAFGAATAMGLKSAVDASISFESAFAGVRKTVTASEAEFAQMQADIRQLAKDIPVTVEELSGIGEAAGQLGISTDHLMGFTRVMADLGVATNMSSEEAATSLARLANITQMPQEEFDRLGSTVVDLGNNLATTEGEIVEMGLRLAGAGAQVGMTEAQILGLGGALSSVGIRAEAGGSAISKVMIEIASEVENGGDKLALFAETAGMTAEQFSEAYREDATEAIIRFIEGLGNMEAQGGSTLGVLEELGIEEVRMRDALLRTSGAGDVLREAIDRANGAWEENIALTVEAEQRYGTTESQLAMAGNRVNDMKIALGDALAPAMLGAANAAANMAERFSALSPEAQRATAFVAAATSGVTLLGGAALIAIPRVAALNASLAASGGIAGAYGAALGSTARFITGPWGVALGAATLGVKAFRDEKQRATEAGERLQAMLDTQGESLSAVSREWATAEIRASGLHGAMLEAGIGTDTIIAALEGYPGAQQKVNEALDYGVLSLDRWRDAIIPNIGGLNRFGSEAGRLRELITDLRPKFEAANREMEHQNQVIAQSGAGVFFDTLDHGADTTREMAAAASAAGMTVEEFGQFAAETGIDISGLTDETGEAVKLFDALAPSVTAAFDALAGGFDPMTRYGELLASHNDMLRKDAQATADAHNESIDEQIDALRRRTDAEIEAYKNETLVAEDGSRVKRSFYREETESVVASMEEQRDARISALEDQRKASDDYYREEAVSFGLYMEAQHQALADQREWYANLNEIRAVAGDDYADMLAAQGPEYASLHAEIARQEHDEIRHAAAHAQEIRDEAATEAIERLIRHGVEFVDETGTYNAEAVTETAEQLGTTVPVVEGILNRSNAIADQRLQSMIGIFRSAGESSSRDMKRKLGEAIPEVARIARQYGIDVGDAIAPLLSAIGDDRSAQAVARYIRGETITGLNEGGLLPGRGPNRDTVPAMLTRGEYVEPRDSVDYYGPDVFEAFRDRRVPREVARQAILGFNTGGRVTGDIAGLNLEFLGRLQRWAGSLNDTYHVTSGFRSRAEQERLYAMYLAGTGNLAARPGTSRHEFGLAADGPRWGHRGPRLFNMHYNVGGEPWHIEPIDAAALMGGATASGSLAGMAVQVPRPPVFPHRGVARSADNVAAYLHRVTQAFADANAMAPATHVAGGGGVALGGLAEIAHQFGWGSGLQFAALQELMRRESGGRATAQNPRSTAYGRWQFLDSTWATVGGRKTSDPDLQDLYAMRYIAQRYGTPQAALAFHDRNNWYNQGGVVGMAGGGIITEPISGIGASGQRYAFGENGPEEVRPFNTGGLVGGMPAAPRFAGSSLRLDPDEYRRRVGVNNRLFELGLLTVDQHLSNLERRMLRTVPFSDEWMDLFNQRKRLVDDLLEDHLQAVEEAQRQQGDAFDRLNQLLDERQRVTERIADEEARALDEGNRAHERANDERLRIERRFNDERARIIRSRADALAGALPMEERAVSQWANSIQAILRNEAERALQREQWAEGLDVLRGMGLSEDAIAAFGLEDLTEESLAKVRLWSTSTEAEIAALNAAIAERQRFAGDQAADEAERLLGAVGEELVGLTEQTAAEMEAVREELAETLATIDADLTDNLAALNEEMATIGLDTGRNWSQAMAEGIMSGIPGILAAVEAAREAQRGRVAAEEALRAAEDTAASNPPTGRSAEVAPLGHHYVLPDGRHMLRLSDQTWYQATGPGQIRELHRLYGAPSQHPGIASNRILGSLVSLFGAGGMEQFASAQIQPRYFDDGGWLPPNSVTLAANATSRWESVGAGTHMPPVGSAKSERLLERIAKAVEVAASKGETQIVLDTGALAGAVSKRQADAGDDFRLRTRSGRAAAR